MNQGIITFNGVVLSDIGKAVYTLSRQPEKTEKPSRYITTIDIVISLHSHAPSSQRAKIAAIQNALNTVEGQLIMHDENKTPLTYLATPAGDSLNEYLQHGRNTVNISFRTWTKIGSGYTGADAVYTPISGSAITLHNVTNFTQTVRTNRSDERVKNRQLTTSSITFNARTAYANPNDAGPVRLAYLQSQKDQLESLSASAEGNLKWLNIDEPIQTENITFTIDDSCEYLNVSYQGRYAKLPNNSTAEAQYTVTTSEPCAEGVITTSISGSIEAKDKATATAKLNTLINTYKTSARRLEKKDVTDNYDDGYDGLGWKGLNFSLEFKEGNPAGAGFTLSIDNTESSSGHKTTYSGTSKATSLSVALAKARELGDLKHPVQDSCTETISYVKDCAVPNTPAFAEVRFSYTYSTPAERCRGSVTCQTSKPAFSDYTTTISGSISAPTLAEAQTKARSYIPSSTCLRTNDETEAKNIFKASGAGAEQFITLSFSYSYLQTHTATTIQQSISEQVDYTSMISTKTISGTIYSPSLSAAKNAYQQLKPAISSGSGVTGETLTESLEDCGSGVMKHVKFDFSFTWKEKVTGTIGHDILEATYRLERQGQIENRPITEIPCGKPIAQPEFGCTTGTLTASGTIKARVKTTAISWGQSKRSQAANQGGHSGIPQKPTESIGVEYLPCTGATSSDILTYTFSFSYPFIYVDGLMGLWPASMAVG